MPVFVPVARQMGMEGYVPHTLTLEDFVGVSETNHRRASISLFPSQFLATYVHHPQISIVY